jgi:hypothetical protein
MPRTTPSLKDKALAHPENKAMTGRMLMDTLVNIYKDPTLGPAALEKPVRMYSDEEGNGIFQLWQIDIDGSGQVSLLPAGDDLSGM